MIFKLKTLDHSYRWRHVN